MSVITDKSNDRFGSRCNPSVSDVAIPYLFIPSWSGLKQAPLSGSVAGVASVSDKA